MNDLLQNKIAQKAAKVNLLEMYFENGRCKAHELEAAKKDLADLVREIDVEEKGPQGSENNRQQVIGKEENSPLTTHHSQPFYEPDTPQASDLLAVKHQLLMAQRELRKKQADLGNTMAMMDKEVVAVDICEEQINLAHKIEGIWDQYRYIERHGHLPTPDDAHEPQELTPAQEAKLLKTKEDLRKLYDKRSKLKAKLKNPSAHAKTFATMKTKPAEWEAELAFAEQEIKALELVRMELEN